MGYNGAHMVKKVKYVWFLSDSTSKRCSKTIFAQTGKKQNSLGNEMVSYDNFQFLNEWNFWLHKDMGPIATALQLKREEY